MVPTTPAEARDYLAGLARANDHEIDELRSFPIEIKLQQIWSMMGATLLLGNDVRRDTEIREVRERWIRLHQAQCD